MEQIDVTIRLTWNQKILIDIIISPVIYINLNYLKIDMAQELLLVFLEYMLQDYISGIRQLYLQLRSSIDMYY